MKASVHEFGVEINVTPKMRAWFAYQGFPLKKTTNQITIPERSFLRSTFDEELKKITNYTHKKLVLVLTGEIKGKNFYETLGVYLQGRVQKKIKDIQSPPLHPLTIQNRQKASGKKKNPSVLQDTGTMWQHITYKIEKV